MGDAGIMINLMLMVLNLLPIPPLDGSHIVAGMLPKAIAIRYERIAPYGFFILLPYYIRRYKYDYASSNPVFIWVDKYCFWLILMGLVYGLIFTASYQRKFGFVFWWLCYDFLIFIDIFFCKFFRGELHALVIFLGINNHDC